MSQRVRNPFIAKGVRRFGRSKAYSRSGKWAVKTKGPLDAAPAEETTVDKTFQGGVRKVPKQKQSRYYAAEDVSTPLYSRKKNTNPQKVRESLVPGAILILLSGKFRGKRVVLLKVLDSGLLLISGPYAVNGVPLRRVNAAYVIGTSTVLDLENVNIPDHLNDEYFKRPASANSAEFGEEADAGKNTISQERKDDQKAVDSGLLQVITPPVKAYLNARFSLSKRDYPHQMKF
eukprot:TRINITY_DN1199_c0_g1_i1.p1 TRINITY_DN1199_c0_g1~~TRINITY_DN1199_c0_g1_i1.p1  ORF type:complete len:232 (+),score=70.09 TRINITY_DN1199_c0_g1_i1:27-722(+)